MTNAVSLPVDHRQRLVALDPRRSICVTAPAGAGKTQLLSQRVLTLLAEAEQPEEILAITFTRKAAAQMHHRIIQALYLALEQEPEEEHKRLSWQLAKKVLIRDKLKHWQLLANPNRLKIQTIDSLCASLTKQMPILANFGAQPHIAESPQIYYRHAVHSLLHQLEGDSAIAGDLMNLLAHVDNDLAKVERLLMALIQRRDQWLLHIGMGANTDVARQVLENTLKQITVDVLQKLQRLLAPIAASLLELLDYAGSNLREKNSPSSVAVLAGITELPSNNTDALLQWRAIADLLLTKTGAWRKSVNKSIGFPTQTLDGDKARAKERKNTFSQLLLELSEHNDLLAVLQELRYLPATTYNEQQWQMLKSLTRLLPSLVAELTLAFQQNGEVDYSQMAIAALHALGDGLSPSELALKLDHQLRHILVDEFQDTASTQYSLLERLLEGWQEHNNNNPDRPNTVFIVGDGMQSIYGFREANVGLFLGARKRGINSLQLDDVPLTVNFRSTPTIVDWINTTFAQAFPSTENLSRGAVPFEQAQAFQPDHQHSIVQILGFTGEQARAAEAEKTLQLVQQSLQNSATDSIAVLVRSRSHLLDIIPVFSQAGIAWNATDIEPLSNVGVIIDLLTLTKALLNSADRISWTALLRTPWVGLNNSDLHGLLVGSTHFPATSVHKKTQQSVWSALCDQQRINTLSNHAKERLPVVRDILLNALCSRQRLSLRSWVEGVWVQLGGIACLSDQQQLTAVDDFFDLLESFQQQHRLGLDEFEQAVQTLYGAPGTQETVLQVMTIHKAKGLEFDTVILPGMARSTRSDDKSLLMWREYLPADQHTGRHSDPGLIISPLGAVGDEQDSIYQHLRYEQTQAGILENTRLFYVAATRAVKNLYILFEAQRDEKRDAIKPPTGNSLLSSLWPALKDTVIWHSDGSAKKQQMGLDFEAATPMVLSRRLSADWQPPECRVNNPLEEYYLDDEYAIGRLVESDMLAEQKNHPDPIQDQLARSVGTVIHQVLEQLVHNGPQYWRAMSAQHRQQWLQNILHHAGLDSPRWPQAIQAISLAVNNTVNDAKGRWILSSTHQHSVCEWELLACFPAAVKQRVIDRSFIDSDGVRWIIDYKTSQPNEHESREAFIQRETNKYRNQLAEYASYLSVLEQRRQTSMIKTALYFTYYPHWEELSV